MIVTISCHKGIPIKLKGGGMEFDFKAAGRSRMEQSCVGFLRAYWKHKGDLERAKGGSR